MMFTVVVPVYNVDRFLSECLLSLTEQDFEDFEVILVDDGSTDESANICHNFKSSYSGNCSYIRQENSGLLATRMRGNAVAKGNYIVSLDGDDCLARNALSELQKVVDSYKPDIIQYGISRSNDFTGRFNVLPWSSSRLFNQVNLIDVFRVLCASYSMNSMCSKAIRRELVQNSITNEEYNRLSFGEDLLQVIPILDAAETVYYLDKNLYYYRLNFNSISKRYSISQFDEITYVREALLSYAAKWQRRYNSDDLISAVRGYNLQACAELIQRACQSKSFQDASEDIVRITTSEFYINASTDKNAWAYPRADYQLIAHLAQSFSPRIVWLASRLKSAFSRSKAEIIHV